MAKSTNALSQTLVQLSGAGHLEEIIVEYCEELVQDTGDAIEKLGRAYDDIQECDRKYVNCLDGPIFNNNPVECLVDYYECVGRQLKDIVETCGFFAHDLVDATQKALEDAASQGIEDEFIEWLYGPGGEVCLSVAADVSFFCSELTIDPAP